MKVVALAFREFNVDIELILADDHSDDGSTEWASRSKLFDQIYFKPVREPFCLNTIRNEAINLASNQHVILIDSSNIPVSTFLEGHNETLSTADCISSGAIIRCDCDAIDIIENKKISFASKNILPCLCWGVMGGNMGFSKSLWNRIGRFDEDYNGCWGYDDNDFSLRALIHGYKLLMNKKSTALHMPHAVTWERSFENNRNLDLMRSKYGPIVDQMLEIDKNPS